MLIQEVEFASAGSDACQDLPVDLPLMKQIAFHVDVPEAGLWPLGGTLVVMSVAACD